MEKLREVRARGDSDFRVDDFDSMPYLLAVGKVRPCQSLERVDRLTGCTGNLEGTSDRG